MVLLLNFLLDTWQFVYEIVATRDEYLWHSILLAASSFILKSKENEFSMPRIPYTWSKCLSNTCITRYRT